MHEVLVNRLGGLSLPRKSVVRLTDRPDMTLDVYRGRKTTNQQQLEKKCAIIGNSRIHRYNPIKPPSFTTYTHIISKRYLNLYALRQEFVNVEKELGH